MVFYRRNRDAGGTYFFTVNLADRKRALLAERADVLRTIVRDVRAELPFVIDAMVVMPDHWHAVWTLPPGDSAYTRRIRLIKARFTRHLTRAGVSLAVDARGEYQLWQKRFWEHTIRDDQDFEAHINYVHINPVKHGYVKRASNWPHSTLHRYIRDGVVSNDWACDGVEGEFGERRSPDGADA